MKIRAIILAFFFIDFLLAQSSCIPGGQPEKLSLGKKKFDLWKLSLLPAPAFPFLLLKPLTYMNNSGESVAEICSYYNIPPEQIVVAHDEMDLPLGTVRMKFAGGSAGHKGINSIVQRIGTPNFYRIRFGIGKPALGDTVSFVLGKFTPSEKKIIDPIFEVAHSGILDLNQKGFEEAQTRVNSYKALPI